MSTQPETAEAPMVLACPPWCAPAGKHPEFSRHETGEHAGCPVRLHERPLVEVSVPSAGEDATVYVLMTAADVIRYLDDGICIEHTPPSLEVFVDAFGTATTLPLNMAEAEELMEAMNHALSALRAAVAR